MEDIEIKMERAKPKRAQLRITNRKTLATVVVMEGSPNQVLDLQAEVENVLRGA